jgi:catechol 2,3-dioxygenase-like lactoylglutathione lyase family enzyme
MAGIVGSMQEVGSNHVVNGLPTLRGLDHVGFTVPDIEQATRFFVTVIGCRLVYALASMRDLQGGWMQQHLNVHPRAEVKSIRLFRCGHGSNFEIFEYDAPDQVTRQPRNSDIGGHHLAFYVDDFAAALAHLRAHEVRILGEPTVRTTGPSAGQTWVYFLTPWDMQLELVSFPAGKGYEATTTERLWHPANPGQ